MQHFSFRLLILYFFLVSGMDAYAQPKMTVQVDERIIALEDYLHVQFTIENAQKVSRFIPPSFKGFKVVQGPNYTNGWSLLNGVMKEYTAISFVLKPVKKGKFTIQPAVASADKLNLQSEAVVIEVNDKGSNTYLPAEKQAGNQPLNDMILKKGESIREKIKNNLFVKLELSKTSVYVGEPLVATYKLFTRLNSESKVTRRPSFSGFSVFDMADPESEQASFEKYNGREYNVYLLRKVQLYPLQAGIYELEEIQVDNNVSFIKEEFARDENTLNGILRAFGEEGIGPAAWVKEAVTVSSLPQAVTVKPLPLDNQPQNFTGAIGQFIIQTSINETEVAVGDIMNLTLVIEGSGNLQVMGTPEINWPKEVETFEPETKEEFNKLVTPITGKKIISIPFSPSVAGQFTIPPVRLSVFNPATGKYIESTTNAIPFRVIPATVKAAKSAKTNRQPAVGFMEKRELPWYYIWIPLLAIGLIALFFFLKRDKQKSKTGKNIKEPIVPVASVLPEAAVQQLRLFPHIYNLDKAKEYFLTGRYADGYREMEQVIVSVMENRYEVKRGESFDNVLSGLQRKFVSADLAGQTVSLLQDCQVALYSPLIHDNQAMEDYEKASIILDKLQSTHA